MPDGYYEIGTANAEDCQASSSGFANDSASMNVGSFDSVLYQAHLRIKLDIPKKAVIDSARLWVYGSLLNGTVDYIDVGAEDWDNAPAYTSNPWTRPRISEEVAWAGWTSTAKWYGSSDIKAVVQAIVNRSGWQSGNYIGLVLRAPHLTGTNHLAIMQSNNNWIHVLEVEWHTATKCVKVAHVEASADDTFNAEVDPTGHITEELCNFGTTMLNESEVQPVRAFFRFAPGICKGSEVVSVDSARLVIRAPSNYSTNGWYTQVQAVDDESVFPLDASVFARAVIPGQAPEPWVMSAWTSKKFYSSPDISDAIAARIAQEDYDPDGSGDQSYICLRMDEGDSDAKNENRNVTAYDKAGVDRRMTLAVGYTTDPDESMLDLIGGARKEISLIGGASKRPRSQA